MGIEQVLETIGLDEKEAKVYLACLKIGQETAYNITQKSGLKRPTVYFILDKLIKRGFASLKQTPKATYYSVISPAKLLLKVNQEKNNLEKIIPYLESVYREQPHKPKIEIYEGKKGIDLIYREATEYLKKGDEIIYFGSIEHFLGEYKDLLDLWVEVMKNKKFKAREILMKEELKNSDYISKVKANNNPNHQIRFFPRGIRFIENDNMIYGNKLAIFSLRKEVFVILIESENISQSYRNFFEMAWRGIR